MYAASVGETPNFEECDENSDYYTYDLTIKWKFIVVTIQNYRSNSNL